MVGQSIARIIPPDRSRELTVILAEVARGERIVDRESVGLTRDGRRVPVSLTISPIHDDRGRVVGASTIARDISERTRAEAALVASEARFRAVTDTAIDAIISADSDGRIRSWNHGAEQMFGWTAAEVTGRPLTVLMPAELHAGHEQGIAHVRLTGRSALAGIPYRRTALRKDGSTLPVEVTIGLTESTENRLIVGVVRDISDRERAERRLLEAKQAAEVWAAELGRSNVELEQFAYGTSHDLAEPLRTITLYTQLLQRGYHDQLDDTANTYLTTIVDGTRRMRALVAGLLSYSRAGHAELDARPVDLADLVASVLADLEAGIAEAGAHVEVGELPTVHADPTLLRQVVQNLLANAVKFRHPKAAPVVQVSAARDDGGWRLSVADNGIGIDPTQHERAFMMFQRLNARHEYAGTGVGLAVCKRIVERHGGRIWFEPRDGGGTTFHLTIPDQGPMAAAQPRAAARREPPLRLR